MGEVESAWGSAVAVTCDLVAAVPADKWSVLAVFELDDIASDPALRVALDCHLEDYLRVAASDLNGEIFV